MTTIAERAAEQADVASAVDNLEIRRDELKAALAVRREDRQTAGLKEQLRLVESDLTLTRAQLEPEKK